MSGIDIQALEEEYEDGFQPPPRQAPSGTSVERSADEPVGRVVGLQKRWTDVVIGGRHLPAVYGGAMEGQSVVVGDRVRVRPARHDTDTARVVEQLVRASVLARTSDDDRVEERPVVANADRVAVVVAVDALDRGTRFADRVLVAAEAGGLTGALVINKCDLVDGVSREVVAEVSARYASLGYPVVHTSAVTGAGLDDLADLLTGRHPDTGGPDGEHTPSRKTDNTSGAYWTVLAGHSGVGKTSLVNRFVPGADRPVGEMGRYGGRHITADPRAMQLPDRPGAWLVDTPGVRSFGLGHVEPEELAGCFPELRGLPCQLPGCQHAGEPGCAVPDRLKKDIHPARYDSYRRLLTARRQAPKVYRSDED